MPKKAAAPKHQYTFGDITVELTNVDRIVFPDLGIAKKEVLDYYYRVADLMLPELRDRPLTMERFTKPVTSGGFFQKHAQKHYPPWIDRVVIGGKTTVEYPIANSAAALVYFANQGGVAFHIWTSRTTDLDHPDLVVFDLDPPDGKFDLVVQVAKLLHELLDDLGLPAFVKTTGSKGLHVVVPVDGVATYAQVNELLQAVAKLLCGRFPELVTLEFYKKDRKGRLFFDTLRNVAGATFVAPWSLRGRPGAPISAPLTWPELDDPKLRANSIGLRDFQARFDAHGDPWYGFRKHPGSVASAMRKLARFKK
jgi:bifunctional non-homologous end joining protein LigD